MVVPVNTAYTVLTVFTVKPVMAYLSGLPVNTAYTVFTVNVDLGSNCEITVITVDTVVTVRTAISVTSTCVI